MAPYACAKARSKAMVWRPVAIEAKGKRPATPVWRPMNMRVMLSTRRFLIANCGALVTSCENRPLSLPSRAMVRSRSLVLIADTVSKKLRLNSSLPSFSATRWPSCQ